MIQRNIWLIFMFAFSQFGSGQDGELAFEEFQKLHSQLTTENKIWNSIPWHTDLVSGQNAAIEQKKLLFIWAMDGHPMGCT